MSVEPSWAFLTRVLLRFPELSQKTSLAPLALGVTNVLAKHSADHSLKPMWRELAQVLRPLLHADGLAVVQVSSAFADAYDVAVLGQDGLKLSELELLETAFFEKRAGELFSLNQLLSIKDAKKELFVEQPLGKRLQVGSFVLMPLMRTPQSNIVLLMSRSEVSAFHVGEYPAFSFVANCVSQDLRHVVLYKEALADPETGLLSRPAFLDALSSEVMRARRYQSAFSLSGLCFDMSFLDNAKKKLALRLTQEMRQTDLIGYAGEGVYLVAHPLTPIKNACEAMERLRASFKEDPPTPEDATHPLSFAVGISALRLDEDDDAFQLLRRADLAMCASKRLRAERIVLDAGSKKYMK
jgi:diguanylate cyclase (GGDEF)-like protein